MSAHWRVVVGWGLFNLLALVAMIVITVIVSVGIGLAAGLDQASGVAGVVGGVIGALVTVLIETVLIVGLYRLMLRPADPGFLHLRVGRDEFRLFAVLLSMVAAIVVLSIPAVALAAALQGARGGQLLAVAAALGVFGWLALRFGLTAPISFAERRIDFSRSWRLTRGQGWALLGMWFLNFCLVAIVWLALYLAVFVASGLLTGFHGFASADNGEALVSHPGRYVLEAVAPILSLPAMLALSQAPWMAVYRILSAPPAEPATI